MTDQEKAFEKLSKLKVGALFMEMGTGKTKVALDLINSKIHKVEYILWICPFSIKNEIEDERKKWHPNLNIDIVGIETISMSDRTYLEILNRSIKNNTFIVVDESLKIKNLNALRTKRILEIGKHCKYKLILNGTPISKNVLDLYTQMNFLSPKILDMSFNQFKNQYCEYYIRGKMKNKVKKQYNIEHLISLISPYVFDAELDLGKAKHYQSFNYEIENKQEYENTKYSFFDLDNDINFFSFTNKLQHIYCSSENKKKLVENISNSIDGQVIVFVKYLDSIPDGAKSMTGYNSKEQRNKILNDFKNRKFKTLYMTYGCGAYGLNLQNCHNVIFADHTFDYAERIQAEARIYRMGQTNNANYINMNCNCGLDNLIRMCQKKKIKLSTEIKSEINKRGVEEWLKNI